ncbi:MAG: 50S ribosomal protein L29 [Holosporales bacterium]|jgi:ribosomal protein L29|nr:50S ribosomal protein L29 [Holosporales bacterium]
MKAKGKKIGAVESENKLDETRRDLLRLRFRRAVGESVSGRRFRELRKEIARCLTMMNNKRA